MGKGCFESLEVFSSLKEHQPWDFVEFRKIVL